MRTRRPKHRRSRARRQCARSRSMLPAPRKSPSTSCRRSIAPSSLLVEMEYSDPNGEILAVATRVPLHTAGVYVGVKPEGWAASKSAVRAQVIAVDAAGKPLRESLGQRRRVRAQELFEPAPSRRRLLRVRLDHRNEKGRLRLLRHDGCARARVLHGEAAHDRRSHSGRAREGRRRSRVAGQRERLGPRRRRLVVRAGQQRPHRSDSREEALRARRDGQVPGAHAVPRGDGARHRRARRCPVEAGRSARRQVAGDRGPHRRHLRTERVRLGARAARPRRSGSAGAVRVAEEHLLPRRALARLHRRHAGRARHASDGARRSRRNLRTSSA